MTVANTYANDLIAAVFIEAGCLMPGAKVHGFEIHQDLNYDTQYVYGMNGLTTPVHISNGTMTTLWLKTGPSYWGQAQTVSALTSALMTLFKVSQVYMISTEINISEFSDHADWKIMFTAPDIQTSHLIPPEPPPLPPPVPVPIPVLDISQYSVKAMSGQRKLKI